MVQLLARRWSPEQISYELRHRFPGQPERHLVPETIYQAIYVQGRGGLRRELHRTNGLLRQYFAKGTDLSVHTAADLAAVAAELNTRHRPQLVNARSKASANACAAGVASCFFEPRFSLSRYLTTMRLESVLDHHETVLPHPPPEVVSL